MKKTLFCLLTLLISYSFCFAAPEFDFRGVTWGMTMAEVDKLETGRKLASEEYVPYWAAYLKKPADGFDWFGRGDMPAYETVEPILGLRRGFAYYVLTDDFYTKKYGIPQGLLHIAAYRLTYRNETQQAFIDFYKLLDLMTEQYGEPDFRGVNENGFLVYACKNQDGPDDNACEQEAEFALRFINGRADWKNVWNDFSVSVILDNDENENYFLVVEYSLNEEGPTLSGWKQNNRRLRSIRK